MTLAAATTRDDYVATSGQTVFPYTFTALVDSDVEVLKNGIALTLGAGNDYTISGIGTGSGNVTLNVGAATGDKIAIYLDMPIARTTNYQNSGPFLALDVNGDMNKAYLAMQQITTDMQAAIRRPEADPATVGMELPVAADRAQKLLAFDINGAVKTEPYLNNETVILNVQDEVGDGVTTTYSLLTSVNSPNLLQIAIDGLLQEVSSYSVSGGNLIFSVAPPFQSVIEIRSFIQKELTTTDLTTSDFAGNGSTASFTLGASAVKQNTFVYINGVYQFKSTYSVSGTTITFSTAPPVNSGIEVVIAGFTTSVIGTTSADLVSYIPASGGVTDVQTALRNISASADLLLNQFTSNGSTTTFTLSSVAFANNMLVYFDGIYQSKANYTVSGDTPAVITFSTAPPLFTAIEIMVSTVSAIEIGVPSDGTVTAPKIGNNAVTRDKIADDAVGADQLASNAVVTASIAGNAVTTAKIADSNVTTVKIASNAVTTVKIADANVTTVKIADANVTTAKIADDAVTAAKIADDAVTAAKIASVPITVGITSVVTATSITATVNTHVYVSAATKTITLPASPAIGQRVLITVGNFTDTVVGRNGSNIMSSATDFTMDAAYLSIQFIYTDATQGWVMS